MENTGDGVEWEGKMSVHLSKALGLPAMIKFWVLGSGTHLFKYLLIGKLTSTERVGESH